MYNLHKSLCDVLNWNFAVSLLLWFKNTCFQESRMNEQIVIWKIIFDVVMKSSFCFYHLLQLVSILRHSSWNMTYLISIKKEFSRSKTTYLNRGWGNRYLELPNHITCLRVYLVCYLDCIRKHMISNFIHPFVYKCEVAFYDIIF